MIIRIFIPLYLLTMTALTFGAGLYMAAKAYAIEAKIVSQLAEVESLRKKSAPIRLKQKIFIALNKRAPYLGDKEKWQIADVIIKSGAEHGHDPYLLLAVIETESSYRSRVVSDKGAVGLMQIRPFVAFKLSRELDRRTIVKTALYDPATNVRLGAYYLAKLILEFDGDLTMALEAYNRGPSRLKRHLAESREIKTGYTRKVLRIRDDIKRSAGISI